MNESIYCAAQYNLFNKVKKPSEVFLMNRSLFKNAGKYKEIVQQG